MWVGQAASVGTGIGAALAAFLLSLPDRSRRWALLPLPPLAVWLSMIGYQCLSNSVAFDPDGLHWGEAARHRALLTALIERIDAGADQIDMHFRPARLGALLDVAAPSPRRPPGVELTVRIGIASGPVIVGDQIGEGTASETAVVGETPNLAACLQALARCQPAFKANAASGPR